MNKENREMRISVKSSRRSGRLGLLATVAASIALLCTAAGASPASAEFGLNNVDVTFTNEDGSVATQAGSHPFAVDLRFQINNTEVAPFEWEPDGEVKSLLIEQIEGMIGDATAMPRCTAAQFFQATLQSSCPTETQVGVIAVSLAFPIAWTGSTVSNLTPPPGVAVRLGFNVAQLRLVIDIGIDDEAPYNIVGAQTDAPQILKIFGGRLQLWGNPADPAHDLLRSEPENNSCWVQSNGVQPGFGADVNEVGFVPAGTPCPAGIPHPKPLLTLPTSCDGPKTTIFETESWQNPGVLIKDSVLTHDLAEPPSPQGFTGCGKLGFKPAIESKATTSQAETGTGLDFNAGFDDEGLTNASGLAQSQTKKAVVTLPEGVTINPSVGEGLGVCTPADLGRETLDSDPGDGCPNSSKVGTLRLETPIVEEDIGGSVFLAEQDDPTTTEPGVENPFDSLIALYLVLRNTNLGAIVKLPLLVEPDPVTGRLVATLEDIPQVPFSHFNFHFREGVRAALVTPPTCGTHTTEAKFYPWSDPDNPRTVTSSFEITEGVNGGPCPPGGVPPFSPHFEAGSINNNAGSFSPFNMRLIRNDGEQNMTKFSSVLPPGVLGSLAGVAKCPDVAVPVAKSKTGRQELAAPSCPAGSLIGHTLAGAGVGSALTYVGGQVYLAGPYKGAPLSVISITPAVAGPFDAGTVVVRLGLDLDPKTAEVSVDGAASDPIPHIIKGIVLKLRDLRVYVDRPNFTLNPTSCDESSAKARLFGSFLNVLDPGDDVPVDLATRYQAANCLNLGFDPKLGLRLKGGTKRGGHPGLRAVYTPKKGDANIEGLVVRLPRSAFLDQAHIRTICTRVQFAAEACPKAAQYGYIRAWTPLLDEPLQGPVWLRSSNHKLPDLVFDLKGLVDIEVAVRIDSARGGIRATLVDAPDAPLSRVVLNMQGGKKGLIINSRNLCARKSRANVKSTGQNGKLDTKNPVMRPQCKRRKAKRSSHGRASRASLAGASSVG